VRNLLEMRANGLAPDEMISNHPELRRVGIAEAFKFAADNRARYAEFFDKSALRGPGFSADEAAGLPEHLRELSGVVVQ
jgi:hypothetical protein